MEMESTKRQTEINRLPCGLLDLPEEILEHVLMQNEINANDTLCLMQTCSMLRNICQSNNIWCRHIIQRWPSFEGKCDRRSKRSWFDEYKQGKKFSRTVQQLVAGYSAKFYTKTEVSNEAFSDFVALLNEHEYAEDFVIDALMDMVHKGGTEQNLTMKYYAEKILRYIQQTAMSRNIKSFVHQPPEKQMLERGATLLAQWFQPTENISAHEISNTLDDIATEVKKKVSEAFPGHPLVNTEVNHQDLESSLWSCEQCSQILHTLSNVWFSVSQPSSFSANRQFYSDQNNSFIDKVLKAKTGIPITLCIVYLSVARRLGVVCEPINYPTHFLIRFLSSLMLPKERMYTYIDPFNNGRFMSEDTLSGYYSVPVISDIQSAEPLEVISRMIRNLVCIGRNRGSTGDNWLCLRNALELALIISPDDFDYKLMLGRVNLHLNVNLQDVVDSLQIVAQQDQHRMELVAHLIMAAQAQMEANKEEEEESNKRKVKTRNKSKDALYSVGLIMKHRRYDYLCVIYGWDKKCTASEEWIKQMGVHNLPNKHKQPFYNVLVEDGSNRYAAEESLDFAPTPQTISHPEVGKYFCSYKGSYYLPNPEKESEYPEDVELTTSLVRKQYP